MAEHADEADPATVADALPAAEHAWRLAERDLDEGVGLAGLGPRLARLLEAAAGDDVGNAVRAHLERHAPTPAGDQAPPAHDPTRTRVLRAALALHAAAERDVYDAFTRSHVTVRRSDGRAEHVERVLRARRAVVQAVLGALAAPEPLLVPPAGTDWQDCLRGGA